MKKKEILKLIDENPYWGEDAESVIMIRDLKKWFEFNLKDEEDKGITDETFITKKEFKFEINRLWNEIRQISFKFIENRYPEVCHSPNITSTNMPYTTFT